MMTGRISRFTEWQWKRAMCTFEGKSSLQRAFRGVLRFSLGGSWRGQFPSCLNRRCSFSGNSIPNGISRLDLQWPWAGGTGRHGARWNERDNVGQKIRVIRLYIAQLISHVRMREGIAYHVRANYRAKWNGSRRRELFRAIDCSITLNLLSYVGQSGETSKKEEEERGGRRVLDASSFVSADFVGTITAFTHVAATLLKSICSDIHYPRGMIMRVETWEIFACIQIRDIRYKT